MALQSSTEREVEQPELTLEEKHCLIRKYEPVLRFSAGENYFPMKIDWFVEHSALKEHAPKKKTRTIFDEKTSLQEKMAYISQGAIDHYFQFVPDAPITSTIVMMGLILVHVLVIIIAMLPQNVGQLGSGLYHQLDYIKISLIGIVFISWPLFQANRKVHLAIALNLFGLLFFGSLPGITFGVLILVFLWNAILIFFLKGTLFSLMADSASSQNRLKLAFLKYVDVNFPGLILVLNGIGSYLFTYLAMRLLAYQGLLSTEPFILPTTFGVLQISPPIAATILLLTTILLIPSWFYVSEWFFREIEELTRQMIILTCSCVLMVAISAIGSGLGLLESAQGHAVVWVFLFTIAISAGLWFFTHPVKLTHGTPFLDHTNHRKVELGWNGNALFSMFFGSLIWTVGALLSYQGAAHAPVLFFMTSVITTFVVLGSGLANYTLDIRSRQLDSDAPRAKHLYDAILKKKEDKYWYYGRVQVYGTWVILHYMYFYAYNDWRSNAGGLNHHEGDWEAVTIYLHLQNPNTQKGKKQTDRLGDYQPFGMALSQHHDGVFCFWNPPINISTDRLGPEYRVVKKVQRFNSEGKLVDTTHPLIYPALASHANFHWPDLYTTSTHFQGFLQALTARAEKFLANFQAPSGAIDMPIEPPSLLSDLNKLQQASQELGENIYESAKQSLEEIKETVTHMEQKDDEGKSSQAAREDMPDEEPLPIFIPLTQDPPAGLPLEYAAGDGLRLGVYQPDMYLPNEFRLPTRLPQHVIRRETNMQDGRYYLDLEHKHPIDWGELRWNYELIDEDTPWIKFLGLFGRQSGIVDEGGPSSPRWIRLTSKDLPNPSMATIEHTRMRWEGDAKGLAWLDTLLFSMLNNKDIALWARKRALDALTHERQDA